MVRGPRGRVPPGDEERFREYADYLRRTRRGRPEEPVGAGSGIQAQLAGAGAASQWTEALARLRREWWINTAVAIVVFGVTMLYLWLTWTVRLPPPDAHQLEAASHLGLPVEITNSIGMRLRFIPPGQFVMGSPPGEWGRREDEEQRPVRLRTPFYMAVTETTQGEYREVLGTNSSFFAEGPDFPVEYVLWEDAVQFCNELSRREGLPQAYEKTAAGWVCHPDREGYRLPFEAEWEYACRARTTTAVYTGELKGDEATLRNLHRAAWFGANSGGRPHPVGRREPNAWGLYDMLGNVAEWCEDWYAAKPGDLASASQEAKVVRGGGWFSEAAGCRAASRRRRPPDLPWNSAGFRVVRTVNLAVGGPAPGGE